MTKHEVVAAYLAGRIDRREFIRKLTLAGVSAGAAVAYAETLSRSAAAQGAGRGVRGYVTAFQDGEYPVLDTDGDGYTDQEEADCGSDPNDPNSTCEDDGGGGGDWTDPIEVTLPNDVPITIPGLGTFVIGAGSTFGFSGVTLNGDQYQGSFGFNGTVNGQPVNIGIAFSFPASFAWSAGGLRAQTVQRVPFVIDAIESWALPGTEEPETPVRGEILIDGPIVTIEANGKSVALKVTPNLTLPLDPSVQYSFEPISGLPNTGAGPVAGTEGWLVPAAAAGGGLALLSRLLRRSSDAS